MRHTKRRSTYYDDYPRWLIRSSDIKSIGGKPGKTKRTRKGWFF